MPAALRTVYAPRLNPNRNSSSPGSYSSTKNRYASRTLRPSPSPNTPPRIRSKRPLPTPASYRTTCSHPASSPFATTCDSFHTFVGTPLSARFHVPSAQKIKRFAIVNPLLGAAANIANA